MAKVAIIGASGYTGAELIRLINHHSDFTIQALVAERNAGKFLSDVFPNFRHLDLPKITNVNELDVSDIDLVFSALPHGTSQEVISQFSDSVPIVDLSADFRLKSSAVYEKWYGASHVAPHLLNEAVYGLTEFYRDDIKATRLVACTGCNAATGLYALLPLLANDVIAKDNIIIDLKTGVSGAGRSPKQAILHAELSEGTQAYNVAQHRHLAEFDQELSKVAGQPVTVTFVPHLVPQNRGILATIYVRGDSRAIYNCLHSRYRDETFVHLLPIGEHPSTRHVRGSNFVHIGVVPDRRGDHVMLLAVLDNLVKGSSGQAIQNANLMMGLNETTGLLSPPLFP